MSEDSTTYDESVTISASEVDTRHLGPSSLLEMLEGEGDTYSREGDGLESSEQGVLLLNLSPVASPCSSAPSTPRGEDDFTVGEDAPQMQELEAAELEDVEEVFGEDAKGRPFLRAATTERIVKWLAFENDSACHTHTKPSYPFKTDRHGDLDRIELEAFFVSFHLITNPREMFESFSKLYSERVEEPTLNQDILVRQAERFLYYLVESDSIGSDMVPTISAFASKNCSVNFVNDLKHQLMRLKHSVSLYESTVTQVLEEPSVTLSHNRMVHYEGDRLPGYVEDGILAFSSTSLAEALTLLEHEMFSRITCKEYLNHKKPQLTPHLVSMANHFNMATNWVSSEVLAAEPLRQAAVVKKFINLAVKLLDMKNFNGSMEILCGLNNSSVQRLKKIWESIPARYLEILQHVENTLSPLRNFRNYRNALANSLANQQPVVPYAAAHMKDLIFADEGNAATLSNGLINFDRLSVVGKIINQLLRARRVRYSSFQQREEEIRFFANVWWLPEVDLRACSFYQDPNRLAMNGNDNEDDQSNPDRPFGDSKEMQQCIRTIFNLTDDKQRTGWLLGFLKTVHKSVYTIAQVLYSSECEIVSRPRIWKGEIYANAFSGWEALNAMIKIGLVSNRRAGIEIGNKLLRDGYIKAMGKTNSTVFADKFGAWYQFITEEINGVDERELRAAQQIKDMQHRTDRCILVAISSPVTGIRPRLYWSGMDGISCFSGGELVAYLADNMKIPRTEALELCSRLHSYKYLIQVQPEEHVEGFQDSGTVFYKFELERPQRIAKQPETEFVDPDYRKKRMKKRDQLTRNSLMKQSTTNLLKEINLSQDELALLCVMIDPFAGIQPEISTANISYWKGASIIRWISKYQCVSDSEATKVANSLFDRKILLQSTGDKEKRAPSVRHQSLYTLPNIVVTLCGLQKEKRSLPVQTGETSQRRATISSPQEKPSGPILYERAGEAAAKALDDNMTEAPSITTTESDKVDPVLVETHEAVALLLELCHPVTGIKRSEIRISNQKRYLFSGKKFANWLLVHRGIEDAEAQAIFLDFASRGFLITLNGKVPDAFDEISMYCFSIERKEDASSLEPRVEDISVDDITSTTTGFESPIRDDSALENDPEYLQALLASRMKAIENPNSPVRKSIKPKLRKLRDKKAHRVSMPVNEKDQERTYAAPAPALMARASSTDTTVVGEDVHPSLTDIMAEEIEEALASPMSEDGRIPTSLFPGRTVIMEKQHKSESALPKVSRIAPAQTVDLQMVDQETADDTVLTPKRLQGDEPTEESLQLGSTTDDEMSRQTALSEGPDSGLSVSLTQVKRGGSGNEALSPRSRKKFTVRTKSRERIGKILRSPKHTDFEGQLLTLEAAQELVEQMRSSDYPLPTTTHKLKKKTFANSFTGTEACTWLNERIEEVPSMSEMDPLALAQELLSYNLIESLNSKDRYRFEAGNINFYSFRPVGSGGDTPRKRKKRRLLG